MTTAALDVGLVPHDLDAMLAFYKGGLAMSLLDDLEVGKTQLVRFSAGQGILQFNLSSPAPGARSNDQRSASKQGHEATNDRCTRFGSNFSLFG